MLKSTVNLACTQLLMETLLIAGIAYNHFDLPLNIDFLKLMSQTAK